MKRYIYHILLSLVATISLAACELLPVQTTLFNFGFIYSECSSTNATIYCDNLSIVVDGVKIEGMKVELGYKEANSLASGLTIVSTYRTENSTYIFDLEGLTPSTEYEAYIILDGGTYGSDKSLPYYFTTEAHIPTYSTNLSSEVDARGIYADITLKDVAYLVDDNHSDIAAVRIEYQSMKSSDDAWHVVEISADKVLDSTETVRIPEGSGSYLEEDCDYQYRVTIEPADNTMPKLISENIQFKTTFAAVTADIATPVLSIEDETLNATVDSVIVYLDGIQISNGKDIEYGFIYRKVEENDWSSIVEAEYDDAMSISMPLELFEEGANYEFCGVCVAGKERTMSTSEKISINIPKGETPDTPPAPPADGDADTSDIAGTWHLALWRGAVPSFDVYLSITEGGVVSLWQRITTHEWELYYSTAEINNGVISGLYTDGVAWSTSYSISLSGDSMTWVATNDSTDISVYERAELPDDLPTTQHATTRAATRFL